MKAKPVETLVKVVRLRQAQEVATERQSNQRGQRQVKEVGKPSSLRPVRSYQGEFRPRRHPELRKNPKNYRPRRKRVGLKPVLALEEGVGACRQRIPEWREKD